MAFPSEREMTMRDVLMIESLQALRPCAVRSRGRAGMRCRRAAWTPPTPGVSPTWPNRQSKPAGPGDRHARRRL